MNLRLPAALATSAVIALGVAACGSDNKSSTASSSSSSSSVKPVAKIDSLSGKDTAVALDAGFVKALTSLKVAPGPLGSAKITKAGSAVFPITGGNVTYYKPGTVSPYVQGEVDHEGSGLSLTAGGTKVDLENFVVDPGKSQLTGKVKVDGKTVCNADITFRCRFEDWVDIVAGRLDPRKALATGAKVQKQEPQQPEG